ncbi:hypothetical protein PAHAL_1G447100 [Panicum hallii]|uniref:Reverse transcriptase zinc-binding domain-containing protein n=1 Tax=Panicum hallii TaxID=206008 RepID=A0A2T8KYE5_9POAL|nr:hypothetical protein PAHAL_1G447100 [Panicum hallii]
MRVWTADRLLLREWPNYYFCPLCQRNLETALHLVAECPFSQQFWAAASVWANCPSLTPANWSPLALDLLSWFTQLSDVSSQRKKGVGSLIILILWSLWKERNNRIFRQEELPIARVLSLLKDDIRLWIFAGAKHLDSLVGHTFGE